MPTYRVVLYTTVSSYVEVEADDEDTAIDRALEEGLPGLMFLDHTYPDTVEWDVAVDLDGSPEVYRVEKD
jgi:hypothetical protein